MTRLSVRRTVLSLLIVPVLTIGASRLEAEDEPQPNSIRKAVDALLQQLDSPQLSERTRAERSLLDLGPDVLAYLPPPELTPSAAVREAVKNVRIQLERQAARESARASRVQLTGDVTVTQLLKEITSQTRNRVELSATGTHLKGQTLHVEFENLPFWECLDQVCDQLKLEPIFDSDRAALILQPRPAKHPSSVIVQRAGPVRIAAPSAELRPLLGNANDRLVRVSARVSLEPRLRPLFLHFAASDLFGFDSKNQRLQAWNAVATYELPVGDMGREVPVQFDYLLPRTNDSRTIDVRGRLSVQLAAGTERIVFDQTSQTPGATRRRGGVTVRLREVNFEPVENGKLNAAISVTVSYDAGGPAFESHRTWMFHNSVYLETESGQRTAFTDYDTSLQSNGMIGVDYRWERLAAPATQYHFVYEAPTLILDLPVELKLERVPITPSDDAPKE